MLLIQKQTHSWHWSVKYFILRIRFSKISRFSMVLKRLKSHQFFNGVAQIFSYTQTWVLELCFLELSLCTFGTLARNMDRTILGDKNGRENLVNIFVVKFKISLPHREGVRVVFSRTFLVHVWHKCRGADCFCRQMIYSTPRVDLFCALCTSWSVAKYRRFCW